MKFWWILVNKIMKICIFGADGRTGIEVLQYAKNRGYEIVAFVYNEIREGNVLDYEKVLRACTGVDVVVSALGHIKGSDPSMQTKGMVNIIRAMKENNIRRIISLTGTGVRIPEDTPSSIDKILNFIVKIIDPIRVKDGIEHAKVLKNSDLDWTIVRVLKLSNSPKMTYKYRLTTGGPAELHTSRKKVAKVMVDLIDDKNYFRKMPVVSAY
jgi:putative NADH-flavin reductase